MSTYTSPKVSLASSFTRLIGQSEVSLGKIRRSNGDQGAPGENHQPIEDISTAPIICFCHLSWEWVWQRPQQFLSRFSKAHRVLFVETYCSPIERTEIKLKQPVGYPNILVAEIHLPEARWNDGSFIDHERRYSMQRLLEDDLRGRFDHPILWFYDPMCVTAFADQLDERLVVYDCMDELSQFKGAPPELLAREQILLQKADVVFCGGRKMREKRLPVNPNCHFFGTGVDIAHFGRARAHDLPLAKELADLKGPILGYFGVIDERIDYTLITKLADARSDWQIVMVGPTAKVDPKDFPQRHNLHWLGGRTYEQLPGLTKGFSVCLMPFAINAATEYINPTKALEYMAAGRPVVSTAINEVKSNFSSVSRIGKSHEDFIKWCIREVESPTLSRVEAGIRLAAENTWEAIVAKMEVQIAAAAKAKQAPAEERVAAVSVPLSVSSTGLAYV